MYALYVALCMYYHQSNQQLIRLTMVLHTLKAKCFADKLRFSVIQMINIRELKNNFETVSGDLGPILEKSLF